MKLQNPSVISSGTGTPVLLLHSSMSSKLQWYRLMQLLSRNYLTIALDFYGYGEAPFPTNPDGFRLADEVAWIDSLLADMIPPAQPVHVVGHSYGAAVALRYCYQHTREHATPDSRPIRSLSLFEPVSFHLLPKTDPLRLETEAFSQYLEDRVKVEPIQGAELFVDKWSGPGTFASFPDEVKEMLVRAVKKVPVDFLALLNDPLTLEDLSTLYTPVCLLTGRQSPSVTPHIANLLASHLPNCESHQVNGGHMAPLNQPLEVNPLIEKFIRKH